MLAILLNPGLIALAALALSIIWMLRDERDRSRPLLVFALILNLFYGWILQFFMGKENSLVPWKYDFVLAGLDSALGLRSAPIANALQGAWHVPLFVVYQLMVPMMILWFLILRSREQQRSLILAYIVEMVVGPALYAMVPACGPLYAFRGAWLHPPAMAPAAIKLSGMPNAFPSLHIATALVLVHFAEQRKARVFALLFLGGTILATLATGEHYVIDLIAGLAFGCFAAAAGQRRYKRAASLFGVVLCWSLSTRFEYRLLIAHGELLRAWSAITIAAAAFSVFWSWRAVAECRDAEAVSDGTSAMAQA